MIVVVDYGMGNLKSVSKALETLGASVSVSSDPVSIERADKVILPGVGAFPSAMRELSARKLVEPVKDAIAAGKPYLGICLGLQLLFDRGEEGGGTAGLGIIRGTVRKFQWDPSRKTQDPSKTQDPRPKTQGPGPKTRDLSLESSVLSLESSGLSLESCVLSLKVPHMGWNQVIAKKACPLMKDIDPKSFFYFVHSYYGDPTDKSVVALETDYGVRFASMIWHNNVYATQFHPEKSQSVGLKLLENFIKL